MAKNISKAECRGITELARHYYCAECDKKCEIFNELDKIEKYMHYATTKNQRGNPKKFGFNCGDCTNKKIEIILEEWRTRAKSLHSEHINCWKLKQYKFMTPFETVIQITKLVFGIIALYLIYNKI